MNFLVLVLIRNIVAKEPHAAHAFKPLALPSAGIATLAHSLVCDGIPNLDSEYEGPQYVSPVVEVVNILNEVGIHSPEDLLNSLTELLRDIERTAPEEYDFFKRNLSENLLQLRRGNPNCARSPVPVVDQWLNSSRPPDTELFRGDSKESHEQLRTSIGCTCSFLQLEHPRWPTQKVNETFDRFAAVEGACSTSTSWGDVHYQNDQDYTVHRDHPVYNCTLCAELCNSNINCTGFEFPHDGSYCWLWMDGACTAQDSAGFRASDKYTTYFLPELGSPAGVSYADILEQLPFTSPIVAVMLEILSIPQIATAFMTDNYELTVDAVKGLLCGNPPTAQKQSTEPPGTASSASSQAWSSDASADPEAKDVARDPTRSRILQIGSLFAGSEILFAPSNVEVQNIVSRANITFEKVASMFKVFDCYRQLRSTKHVSSGDPGLVIDRWLTVGGGLDVDNIDKMVNAALPDKTWLHVGTGFSSPVDVGNHFGTRIRGVYTANVTGDHVFFIRSDDVGKLYLGTSVASSSRQLIAQNSHAARSFYKYDGQRSTPQQLAAGQKYYIEAVSIDTTSTDFLDVAVALPTGQFLSPIPIQGFLTLPDTIVKNQSRAKLEEDPGILAFYRDFDLFRGFAQSEDMIRAAISDDFNQSIFSIQRQFIAALQFSPHEDGKLVPDPEIVIRMRGGMVPSTQKLSVQVGGFWGAYTWYKYYYSGFVFLQDMIGSAFQADDLNLKSVFVSKKPTPAYIGDFFVLVLQYIMPMFMVLAFLCTAILNVHTIVSERESGANKTLLLMGLPAHIDQLAATMDQLLFSVIQCSVVVIELSAGNVFVSSDPALLFLVFWTFSAASCAGCTAFSGMFSSSRTASTATGIVYICSYFPFEYIRANQDTMSHFSLFALSVVCPPSALGVALSYIVRLEQMDTGLSLSNIGNGFGGCDTFSVGSCILALWTSFLVFSMCSVMQRNYMKFLNMFTWDVSNASRTMADSYTSADVTIYNLSKTYNWGYMWWRNQRAVLNQVSSTIKCGSITVLLGLNGTGKSTLMDIMMGLILPTKGQILVCGQDPSVAKEEVRRITGYCPQHSLSLPFLTGREQVQLVARIRAIDQQTMDQQLREFSKAIALSDRDLSKLTSTYSGGMLRKLSLILAYLGNPRFMLLDEPCAGLDPRSRMMAWRFMKAQNQGKTLLLCTHHMDEADNLADTIMVLKQQSESTASQVIFELPPRKLTERCSFKYSLNVHFFHDANFKIIFDLILKADPTAHVADRGLKNATFLLSSVWIRDRKETLEKLNTFEAEGIVEQYSINSISLQDSFLNLVLDPSDWKSGACSSPQDPSNTFGHFSSDNSTENTSEIFTQPFSVHHELLRMFMITTWKRLKVAQRNKGVFLAQFLLPVVLVGIALGIQLSFGPESNEQPLTLSPDIYEGTCAASHSEIPVRCEESQDETSCSNFSQNLSWGLEETLFHNVSLSWPAICADERKTITSYCLCGESTFNVVHGAAARLKKSSEPSILDLQYWLSYAERAKKPGSHYVGWFNSLDIHSMPSYLSMVSNARFREKNGIPLKTVSYPLQKNAQQLLVDHEASPVPKAAAIFMSIASILAPASNAAYYVKERSSCFKQLQHFAGMNEKIYWITHLTVDILFYLPALVFISVLVFFVDLPPLSKQNQPGAILLFWAHAWAVTPASAAASWLFESSTSAFVVVLVATTLITSICVFAEFLFGLLNSVQGQHVSFDAASSILIWILPGFNLANGFTELSDSHYEFLLAQQQALANDVSEPVRVHGLAWELVGINIFALFVQGSVLWAIVLLCDGPAWLHVRKIIDKIFRRGKVVTSSLSIQAFESGPGDFSSFGVDNEISKVTEYVDSEGRNDVNFNLSLAVVGLRKAYGSLFSLDRLRGWLRSHPTKCMTAVDGIYFGVEAGTCFGLLGANGAGKTTSFKCIIGNIGSFEGRILICGVDVCKDPQTTKVSCGYCPQFEGLCDHLSVAETLKMFLRLKSLDQTRSLDSLVAEQIKSMHLQGFEDTQILECSYGTRRKLSVSLALLGNPAIVLLDEPTAGMDPAGRHFLWNKINESKLRGVSILLTSHSMDECEKLCDKIGILDHGKFKCIGSPHTLRNHFGQHYTVRLQLPNNEDGAIDRKVRSDLQRLLPSCDCGEELKSGWLTVTVPTGGDSASTFQKILQFVDELLEQNLCCGFDIAAVPLDYVFCSVLGGDEGDVSTPVDAAIEISTVVNQAYDTSDFRDEGASTSIENSDDDLDFGDDAPLISNQI